MKHIYKYNHFILEKKIFETIELKEIFNDADILESIVTEYDSLLKTISAEEKDLYNILGLDKNNYDKFVLLEELYDNDDFNKGLVKNKLKKTQIEKTEESETFLDNVIIIKFFLLHDINKNMLENPNYIIFQNKEISSTRWKKIKCYKVNDDIKKFYDKLTNKTIELKRGEKSYIYFTSNSGNDWQLQNADVKDDSFKEFMNNDEIKIILKSKETSITIIN
jgi:hypothetical protein